MGQFAIGVWHVIFALISSTNTQTFKLSLRGVYWPLGYPVSMLRSGLPGVGLRTDEIYHYGKLTLLLSQSFCDDILTNIVSVFYQPVPQMLPLHTLAQIGKREDAFQKFPVFDNFRPNIWELLLICKYDNFVQCVLHFAFAYMYIHGV